MRTDVLKIDYDSPDDGYLNLAASVLNDNGLVVAPTETRYGLLVRADRNILLEKLFEVKKRDMTLPTSIFLSKVSDIENYADLNRKASLLAERFLPGPLTLVLKANISASPPLVIDGKIGIRISSAPVIRELLKKVNYPLSATSANISGSPEPVSIEEIVDMLGKKVNLYLDCGNLTAMPSTVVDCSGIEPLILREGSITQEQIEEVTA